MQELDGDERAELAELRRAQEILGIRRDHVQRDGKLGERVGKLRRGAHIRRGRQDDDIVHLLRAAKLDHAAQLGAIERRLLGACVLARITGDGQGADDAHARFSQALGELRLPRGAPDENGATSLDASGRERGLDSVHARWCAARAPRG